MDQPHDVAHVDPDNISTKSAKRSKKNADESGGICDFIDSIFG